MMLDHYQQTKNLLVSYSAKKLGFFRHRLPWATAMRAGCSNPRTSGASSVSRSCHCFCDAVLPDPSYSRTEGELFCIT
jgi:hypothetical protein